MAITGQELIDRALYELRVIKIGEDISSDRVSHHLWKLNSLIESLSLDDLFLYVEVSESFDLVAGQASYTIGSGGNFNTIRPFNIKDSAYIKDGNTDHRVRKLTDKEYRLRRVKGSQELPRIFAYRREFPLGKLLLYPTPNSSNYDIYIQSEKVLTSFSQASTSVTFAPGYERFLVYALALDLAPSYKKAITTGLAGNYIDAKRKVERKNMSPVEPVQLEIAALGRGGRTTTRDNINAGPFD